VIVQDTEGRDHLEDLDIDEMIILRWMVRTGLMWLRITTGGRLLRYTVMNPWIPSEREFLK
jgi:hypothetical protein